MCAARSGQILNLAALGADCGLSASTAREWLSVLEASYLVTRIQPYYQNFGKRLVKTPKLYFLDVGLMAWLIGIRDTVTLDTHVSRGALFETFVVSELIKRQYNQGQNADLYFWRDSAGNEIDLLLDTPQGLQAIEIKSGSTFASDWIKGFKVWERNTQVNTLIPRIIYGGTDSYDREGHQVMGWPDIGI
jgi:predicted AAA+ superfamily ATPase